VALEDGVVELDLEVDLEAVVGREARPLVAVAHLDGPADADEALRRVLLGNAGRLDEEHEGPGAAVHDRHLGADSSTVALSMPSPASADMRCSMVATRTPSLISDVPSVVSPTCMPSALDLHRRIEVGAAEHDAGIDRRRAEGHEDLLARVQPHAGRPDGVLQSALSQHHGSPLRRRHSGVRRGMASPVSGAPQACNISQDPGALP
jgi:hypothetical protein